MDQLAPVEAKYVVKNLIREMRTGVAEGVVLDALALLADGDRAAVARAHMLEVDLAEVAARVLVHRGQPLAPTAIAYFQPLRPMLALSYQPWWYRPLAIDFYADAAPVLAELRVPVTARFRESFDHLVWPPDWELVPRPLD